MDQDDYKAKGFYGLPHTLKPIRYYLINSDNCSTKLN